MKSYSACDNNKIQLDLKLIEIFKNKTNGTYIELGANDGLNSSNTKLLEESFNWSGILIEPSKDSFSRLLTNRSKNNLFVNKCISDFKGHIKGDFNGSLMSSIDGKRLKDFGISNELVEIECDTLTNILDKYVSCTQNTIDFLSLDVEGHELSVLKGLDLNKYRPTYMLIEIYTNEYNDILSYLNSNNYTLLSNFTNYNKVDNIHWDGTHNDFLFVDKMRPVS